MSTDAGVIWINGERQSPGANHLSARDRGFTLADGLFETMRLHGGVIFRREQHLSRLRRGLRALAIAEPPSLGDWLATAAADAGTDDASIRLTISRGAGPGGVAAPPDARPTVAVVVSPWPFFAAVIYERGLALAIASGRRNEYAMTAGLKTINYTDAVAALLEAQRGGADEALFLDTEGHCSEGTASNLFAWTGDALVTPPLSCAALPGVTRAAVLEIGRALGLDVREAWLGPDALAAAPEAFLTSSLRGIAPIATLAGRAIGEGRPGPMTMRVAEAYRQLVEQECRAVRA